MNFVNDADYLDQHFLTDEKVLNIFIKSANLKKEDIVVEIGPGKGIVSELIINKVKKLYCIEIDKRLSVYLEKLKEKNSNIEIIYDNVLNIYIPPCTKIITSLPYSIIEPFIDKLIRCDFKETLMIIGKKYADGVINDDLNRLSLLTNCYFKTERIIDIAPDSFSPQPRVMSSMIRLVPVNAKNLDYKKRFFRYMFFYRNKTVKNAIIEAFIRMFEDEDITVTQKESKKMVNEIDFSYELLNKKFETCSNEEIKIINEKIDWMYEYGENRLRVGEEKTL